MKDYFSQRLIDFPPVLCRLLVKKREGGRILPMPDGELADRACLPLSEVKRLSWCCSWDDVAFDVAVAFSEACGVSLIDRYQLHRQRVYMRKMKGRFPHLERTEDWKAIWKPLYMEYVKFLQERQNAEPDN